MTPAEIQQVIADFNNGIMICHATWAKVLAHLAATLDKPATPG